jgi:hypothetical protein
VTRRRFFAASTAAVALRAAPSGRPELPFRQVHLDFHTSELIPGVGANFDPAEFASTLKSARVNSINVFAKCHHGWAYYDTKIARPHPNLKTDLLGGMVKGCRANGIHVLYYYSLVWDVAVARLHPEWRMLGRDGKVIGGIPGDAWPWICMNTPYLDQVAAENAEICEKYDVDGAWFDILKQPPEGCYCKWCVEDRKRLRLTDSESDIARHNKLVALKVEKRLDGIVKKRFPNGLTFYNSRLVIGLRDELPYYSHIEIESLPTGGWGYSHFQQRVRYMRTLDKDMVGMTGRFHKSWGDFGGLKNQAALDFECLNFVANGAKCCVGDQLHPGGRLDPTTYARIGKTYARIESLEPWARGTQAVADIGVISTAPFQVQSTQKIPYVDQGFTNMLVELHQQFNVLDIEEDFSRYRVIIVPEEVPPSPKLIEKLDRYQGGVIVSGSFDWDKTGVQLQGPAPYRNAYLLARPGAFPSLDENAYFLYQPGLKAQALAGTEVLATYGYPYFDRSPERFSSHKQTPMGRKSDDPLITQRGSVIYIAAPLFKSYALDGAGAYKIVVGDLLAKLLAKPALLAPGLPSTAQATVLRQPAESRTIVHVLYYPATRRAPDIDVIEEPATLVDQELRVRLDAPPRSVTLVPQNRTVPFRYDNGYAIFRVARIDGHQAIALS